MNRNTVMQYEFDNEIFTEKDTVLVFFSLSNMLYFIAMLFGCIMPIGATVAIAASLSAWVTIIELSKSAFIFQNGAWKSVAGILKYYPTKRRTVRISRYLLILRSMLLELVITAIPMLMFFYWFDIFKFMAALFSVAITMTLISIIGVELSMAA